jgi:hypothetical protein
MIYTIHRDLSHRTSPRPKGEPSWDVKLIYFDGWEDAILENPEIDYTDKVPSVIEFVGNLEVLK